MSRLKHEIYALYLAYKDPRVPWYAKLFAAFVIERPLKVPTDTSKLLSEVSVEQSLALLADRLAEVRSHLGSVTDMLELNSQAVADIGIFNKEEKEALEKLGSKIIALPEPITARRIFFLFFVRTL